MAWPTTPLPIEVSLALGADISADPATWSWTVIGPPFVYVRGGIAPKRGRADEQTQTEASSCKLTLDNRDGRFVPHNPVGPYYGQLGRNTPVRVRVDPGSGFVTRFVDFISEWPPRWDLSEKDHWVEVEANGVLRRLSQGKNPLRSALYRAIMTAPRPIRYWPLEDGQDSEEAVSGLPDQDPMTLSGIVQFGSNTQIRGSAPVAGFSQGGILVGTVYGGAASDTAWSVEFSGTIPDGFYVPVDWLPRGGTITSSWQFAVVSGTIRIFAYPEPNTQLTAINFTPPTFGNAHNWCVTAAQNGADIDVQLYRDGALAATGTLTGQTLGSIRVIRLNPFALTQVVSLGHVAIYNGANQTGHFAASTGYSGEQSGVRFARLCAEQNVFATVTAGAIELMGPQRVATLLDLLRQCESSEEGLMVERRTGELGFNPHTVRENQAVAMTLNYAAGHVSPPLEPTKDDQLVRNDVTITRDGAGIARVEQVDGPLGTDPTTGAGRYDTSDTLSLFTQGQTVGHASWRVNIGTVDELRYPTVTLDLRANPGLIAQWLACDIGSRVKITNLLDNISFDDADLIIEGYEEIFGPFTWTVALHCAPYKPWEVFLLAATSGDTAEFLGRLVPDSMELLIARDATQTSLTVATSPKWTVDADDYPMDLRIAGELIRATAVAAVTPTFVAAGTASHADNASVTPGMPAGVQEGDLLLVFEAIRSTTATCDLPGGYTTIFNNANIRLSGRIHDGTEVAPTCNFTGGAAGDSTSAQMAAFRGLTLDGLGGRTQAGTAAIDIDTPRLELWEIVSGLKGILVDNAVVLLCGWKADDWTSVAPPAGFTEIGEPSTILGNDQGITWAFQIQTAATAIPASSFVVTGGAAVNTRGRIIALRSDVVTLTCTRSVNGVSKPQSQHAPLELADPMVLAL